MGKIYGPNGLPKLPIPLDLEPLIFYVFVHSGAVAKWLRQRIANPPSPVRIRAAPLFLTLAPVRFWSSKSSVDMNLGESFRCSLPATRRLDRTLMPMPKNWVVLTRSLKANVRGSWVRCFSYLITVLVIAVFSNFSNRSNWLRRSRCPIENQIAIRVGHWF